MKIKKPLSIGILVAAATLTMSPVAHAAPSPPPPPDEESFEVFVEPIQVMPEGSSAESEGTSAQAICQAYGIVDYPHFSTSNPSTARAVQAHGGWNRGDCNATRADVTTQLDRRNPIGLLQAVGRQGRGVLPSQADFGLPSSNRVTARYECNGTNAAGFRAWTSFDMIGLADTQTRTHSPVTNPLTCG